MCVGEVAHALCWRSEDSVQELVLSFRHVSPWAQTQVVRLSNNCLGLLIHLTSPKQFIFTEKLNSCLYGQLSIVYSWLYSL